MLSVNKLRNEYDQVLSGLRKRGWDDQRLGIIDEVIRLDDERKRIQTRLDDTLARGNQLSKQIGDLYKEGKHQEAGTAKEEMGRVKEESRELEEQFRDIKSTIEERLLNIPNVPHSLVPDGQDASANEIYRDWKGILPSGEGLLAHWDLASKFDLIDFEMGAFITGSGFPLFKGNGAKLNRALINFFLDQASDAGYLEARPPFLVNEQSARATGQLPDKEGQMYHIQNDNLYLIPTGEVPLTNIYRDRILKEEDFPIRLVGMTPCFRREAGSHGSDVKGLNRVHQFDKVEIVHIEHPDHSYSALEKMLEHVEKLLIKLELPFRILRLCGGDLGFTSAITYDFEVFAAGQQKWLEVSSVSNFEEFQANRMKLRFKDANGKTRLAHTLNGSALALARIVAALLENNQTEKGIRIPKAIQAYLGTDLIN